MEENILARMAQPGSVHQLAMFRILLGLQILYSSSSRGFQLLQQVNNTSGTKNIFPEFLNQWVDSIAVPYLQPIIMVVSVFFVVGLFTRYILPLLFISFLFLFSFFYARHNGPIPWIYIWFPLLLLNFTKCSDALSLDRVLGIIKPLYDKTANAYRWPMEVIAAWLTYIYVAAGLAKLLPVYKALHWLEGGTSQEIIYHRFLDSIYFYIFGRPLFDYTEHQWLFAVLSIGSLVVELACIIILFTQRFNVIIIALLVAMHFFLYLTGVMGFMQLALLLSISLLNPAFFSKLFKEHDYLEVRPTSSS